MTLVVCVYRYTGWTPVEDLELLHFLLLIVKSVVKPLILRI